MDEELQQLVEELEQASKPEDIFSLPLESTNPDEQDELLEQEYKRLKEIADPEQQPRIIHKEIAADCLLLLDKFYQLAKELISLGSYGRSRREEPLWRDEATEFTTAKRTYLLGEAFAEGDHATLYHGECLLDNQPAGRVAIKITNDQKTNHLVLREVMALKQLREECTPQRKHLPILLDQFQTEDNRLALIMRYLNDCPDFYSLREDSRYANGVSRQHMAWMLCRLLSVMGHAHDLGRLHGNIDPSHLIIIPRSHNLCLVGWSHSVFAPKRTGEKFSVFNPEFSAPEVKDNTAALPSADIYSAGMCMIYLLGGDVAEKTIPGDVEDELARFLGSMIMESPLQRAQDAWLLHEQLSSLRVRLWGKTGYVPFEW